MRFFYKKAVSWGLCLTFTSSSILSDALLPLDIPARDAAISSQMDQILDFKLPPAYGTVQEIYRGDSRQVVVHIKDVHGNFEAQKNIARILEAVSGFVLPVSGKIISRFPFRGSRNNEVTNNAQRVTRNGILVLIEGAQGPIDTQLFTEIENKKMRKDIVDYFLRQGSLKASEYHAISQNQKVELVGVENPQLYFENLNSYQQSYARQNEVLKSLQEIQDVLDILKPKIFSEDELKLINAEEQHREGQMSFLDYVQFLKSFSAPYQMDLNHFESLKLLLKCIELGERVHFEALQKEREDLARQLEKKSTREDVQELLKKALLLRLEKISAWEYFHDLKDQALENEISFEAYANLKIYLEFLDLQKKLDYLRFYQDIQAFETQLKQALFKSDEKSGLDQIIQYERVLERLFRLEMTREDLDFYRNNRNEILKIHEGVTSLEKAHSLNQALPSIQEHVESCEHFYKFALKRDEAIVDNTLTLLKTHPSRPATVLITGGFHTEGIKKLLREKGISYLVISPRVTQIASSTDYISLLLGEKSPLDLLLERKGTRLDAMSILPNGLQALLAEKDIRLLIGEELAARLSEKFPMLQLTRDLLLEVYEKSRTVQWSEVDGKEVAQVAIEMGQESYKFWLERSRVGSSSQGDRLSKDVLISRIETEDSSDAIHRLVKEYLALISSRKFGKIERVKKTKYGREEISISDLMQELERDPNSYIEVEDLDRMVAVSRMTRGYGAAMAATWDDGKPLWKGILPQMDDHTLRRLKMDLRERVEQERIHQVIQEYMQKISELLKEERQSKTISRLSVYFDHNASDNKEMEDVTLKELIPEMEKGLQIRDGVLLLDLESVKSFLEGNSSSITLRLHRSYERWGRDEKWKTLQSTREQLKQFKEFAKARGELRKGWTEIKEWKGGGKLYEEEVPHLLSELRQRVWIPRITGDQRKFEDIVQTVERICEAAHQSLEGKNYALAYETYDQARSTFSSRTWNIRDGTGTFDQLKGKIEKGLQLALALKDHEEEKSGIPAQLRGEKEALMQKLRSISAGWYESEQFSVERSIDDIQRYNRTDLSSRQSGYKGVEEGFVQNSAPYERDLARYGEILSQIDGLSGETDEITVMVNRERVSFRQWRRNLTDGKMGSVAGLAVAGSIERDELAVEGDVRALGLFQGDMKNIFSMKEDERKKLLSDLEDVLKKLETTRTILEEGRITTREGMITDYRTLLLEYLGLLAKRTDGVVRLFRPDDRQERISIDDLIRRVQGNADFVIEPRHLSRLTTAERQTRGFGAAVPLDFGPILDKVPKGWKKNDIKKAKNELKSRMDQEKIHQVRQRYMTKVLAILEKESQDRSISNLSVNLGENVVGNKELEGATIKDLVSEIRGGLGSQYTDGALFLETDIAKILGGENRWGVSLRLRPCFMQWQREETGWRTVEEAEQTLRTLEEYAQKRASEKALQAAGIDEIINRERILDEVKRFQERYQEKEGTYDLNEELRFWKNLSNEERKVAWAILRHDPNVLNSTEEFPLLQPPDYRALFLSLSQVRMMNYLKEALQGVIKGNPLESQYQSVFESFLNKADQYQTGRIRELSGKLKNFLGGPEREVFLGLSGSFEAVRDQVIISLVLNLDAGEKSDKETLEATLLRVVEEAFISIESSERGDIVRTLVEKKDKFPEMIRQGVFWLNMSRPQFIEKLGKSWDYGDIIRLARLNNVEIGGVDVPSVQLGRFVLEDVRRAIEAFPSNLLWKVARPIPITVKYKRGKEGSAIFVQGATTANDSFRGSITLEVQGQMRGSSVQEVIEHEIAHSLSFSKLRSGEWVLPLEDWKAIAQAIGFYGYYDQWKGRLVRVKEIATVEQILDIPYALWIFKEGDQLINYMRLQDSFELASVPHIPQFFGRMGVTMVVFDSTKDKLKYAKSSLQECIALSIVNAKLERSLNETVMPVRKILARNVLREEFSVKRKDGSVVSFSHMRGEKYWGQYETESLVEGHPALHEVSVSHPGAKGIEAYLESIKDHYSDETVTLVGELLRAGEVEVDFTLSQGAISETTVQGDKLGPPSSKIKKVVVSHLKEVLKSILGREHHLSQAPPDGEYKIKISTNIDALGNIQFLPHQTQNELEISPLSFLNITLLEYALRHELDHALDATSADENTSETLVRDHDRSFFKSLNLKEQLDLLWQLTEKNPNRVDVRDSSGRDVYPELERAFAERYEIPYETEEDKKALWKFIKAYGEGKVDLDRVIFAEGEVSRFTFRDYFYRSSGDAIKHWSSLSVEGSSIEGGYPLMPLGGETFTRLPDPQRVPEAVESAA